MISYAFITISLCLNLRKISVFLSKSFVRKCWRNTAIDLRTSNMTLCAQRCTSLWIFCFSATTTEMTLTQAKLLCVNCVFQWPMMKKRGYMLMKRKSFGANSEMILKISPTTWTVTLSRSLARLTWILMRKFLTAKRRMRLTFCISPKWYICSLIFLTARR